MLGWQIDAYRNVFRTVQMRCPDGPLTEDHLWAVLRAGRCAGRWEIFAARESEAERVRIDAGRWEWQLDGGRRVFEVEPTGRAGSP